MCEPEVSNYPVVLIFMKHIVYASKPMIITYVEDFAQKLSASLNPILFLFFEPSWIQSRRLTLKPWREQWVLGLL